MEIKCLEEKERDIYMRELNTIQKREKLNVIKALDERGNGNANHVYKIEAIVTDDEDIPFTLIKFQNGARKDENSTYGVIDTDLLEIVRDRLKCFQSGEFSTRENACALTHIEEALMWLNLRVEDRIERQVLGTDNK